MKSQVMTNFFGHPINIRTQTTIEGHEICMEGLKGHGGRSFPR